MSVRDIIQSNPYRVLGVFTNDSSATLASNNSRMKAFATIGKSISYPQDMAIVFGSSPERDAAALSSSVAAIASPMERLKHGLFWFMNSTDTDAKALAVLAQTGNLLGARKIWEAGEQNMSSLQNQLVCSLLKDSRSYSKVIQTAWNLYSQYGHEYIKTISNGFDVIAPGDLMSTFLSQIVRYSAGEFLVWDKAIIRCGNSIIKQYWAEVQAEYCIHKLQNALNVAKTTEIHTDKDNFDIAVRLMHQAEPHLKTMKALMEKHPSMLSLYATIADAVCEEILNREITYYNQVTSRERKNRMLMVLDKFCYRYAATVRFKERCKSSINIGLGRSENAQLFPNGTPDKLLFESDRRKRNNGLCAIVEGLLRSFTHDNP